MALPPRLISQQSDDRGARGDNAHEHTAAHTSFNSTFSTPAFSGPQRRDPPFPCLDCNISFQRHTEFIRHGSDKHQPELGRICPHPNCERKFHPDRLYRLREHYELQHGGRLVPVDGLPLNPLQQKVWACGFCVSCFPAWKDLGVHIWTHYKAGFHKQDWNLSVYIYSLLQHSSIWKDWRETVREYTVEGHDELSQYEWPRANVQQLLHELEWDEPHRSAGKIIAKKALHLLRTLQIQTLSSSSQIFVDGSRDGSWEEPLSTTHQLSAVEDPSNPFDFSGAGASDGLTYSASMRTPSVSSYPDHAIMTDHLSDSINARQTGLQTTAMIPRYAADPGLSAISAPSQALNDRDDMVHGTVGTFQTTPAPPLLALEQAAVGHALTTSTNREVTSNLDDPSPVVGLPPQVEYDTEPEPWSQYSVPSMYAQQSNEYDVQSLTSSARTAWERFSDESGEAFQRGT